MIDRVFIGLFFGIIIGGSLMAIIIAALLCYDPNIIKIRWHTYWTNYHRRILYDLNEDGGTFDQYFSDEYKYHLKRYEHHAGKAGEL